MFFRRALLVAGPILTSFLVAAPTVAFARGDEHAVAPASPSTDTGSGGGAGAGWERRGDASDAPTGAAWLGAHYAKREVLVPMRDGTRLFTAIYTPRPDPAWPASREAHPILLRRTPYSCSPYGPDAFPELLGPSALFHEQAYVFVVQDVRGAYASEGEFVDVRPSRRDRAAPLAFDESTDAWDTIEWLVRNVPDTNGRVGAWGISYPGFYASVGMIDAHPALVAVSPQAPIADWWYDDFHHHGALFLPHAFNFLAGFGRARPEPTTKRSYRFDHGTPDGYRFFLDLGSLANVNARHFHGQIRFWNEIVAHPDYDEFWRERDVLPRLEHVAPAVLTVGGWYDAEDLYGALETYRAIEARNPGVFNALVMGPWSHGGWGRTPGDRLGTARFGAKTSLEYQHDLEFAFFEHHLRGVDVATDGVGDPEARRVAGVAEANVFDTGANRWRAFDAWPPAASVARTWWLVPGGGVSSSEPARTIRAFDAFTSDPSRPVPFTQDVTTSMTREYMTDDQRFVATRPDVLVYRSTPLAEGLTLVGRVDVDLLVATSGTDADWIVKLIDEYPPDAADPKGEDALPSGVRMGGMQRLVRSEVVRGRFRDDPARPAPFTPGEVTHVRVPLLDVLHTFAPGHRLAIQVHSTWFPLVDRNPQTFVPSIYAARESDFVAARHEVWRGSTFTARVLPAGAR